MREHLKLKAIVLAVEELLNESKCMEESYLMAMSKPTIGIDASEANKHLISARLKAKVILDSIELMERSRIWNENVKG